MAYVAGMAAVVVVVVAVAVVVYIHPHPLKKEELFMSSVKLAVLLVLVRTLYSFRLIRLDK